MPCNLTAVPGSQGPRLSGSVMVAASLPPEVFPCRGEATEDGEDSSLSPFEQSPFNCKMNEELGLKAASLCSHEIEIRSHDIEQERESCADKRQMRSIN